MCAAHDYSEPGKPRIDWGDPGAKDALVSALVNDANALVAAVQDRDLDERAASALALLALVAGQDVEPAEGSDGTGGRWRIAKKVAGDRVISMVDPDARHTRKSPGARRDGYRAHLAAGPETGIITDEKLTRAAGRDNSDPAVAEEFWPLSPKGKKKPVAAAPPGKPARMVPAARTAAAAVTVRAAVTRWPGTAIPPTAPVTCAMRSRRPGTRR